MENNGYPLPYDEFDDQELFDEDLAVASYTECTGLTPSAPLSNAQLRSYSRIYDIPLGGENEGD